MSSIDITRVIDAQKKDQETLKGIRKNIRERAKLLKNAAEFGEVDDKTAAAIAEVLGTNKSTDK